MLKGARLRLRSITPDDLPRYVAWLNDLEVTRHLTGGLPMNLDDETDWYERQRKNPSDMNFAIDTEAGEHIGSVSLMSIDRLNQMAELGIMIGAKDHWNKGYGAEAIELLLNYAFYNQNLNRVYLRVDVDHLGAIKCYERCGFTTEGEMRQVVFRNGQFRNQFLMSILREEYQ